MIVVFSQKVEPPTITGRFNVVKSIQMVQDDREVIHYYVNFKNATYRGYGFDKLDVSFIPYSE